jgi:hypothetical protein
MIVVTERNFDQVYSRDIRDAYWERVARSLERVFGKNRNLAEDYRRQVEDAAPAEQMLVYHQEPLEVAADLAGVREITTEQQQTYLQIAEDTEPPLAGSPDRP